MSGTFERVLIVGTGLIGGSLAGRIQAHSETTTVVGIDADRGEAELCLERGLLDQVASLEAIESETASADLVLLCAGPDEIVSLLPLVAGALGAGSLATDVASVKRPIIDAARRAFDGSAGRFFGGHPMSGRHLSGARHADPTILEGATWCLVPLDPPGDTDEDSLRLEAFLELCGLRVVRIDDAAHDRIVACTSHLPHLLAACLARSGGRLAHDDPLGPLLSGPSYEGATRVAGAAPGLWQEIFRLNRSEVLQALDDFLEIVRSAKLRLKDGDLTDFLAEARESRRRWEAGIRDEQNTGG